MHTEFRIQRILLKLTQVGAGFDSGIRRQSSSAIPVSLTLRRQGGNFGLTIWRQNAELYFTLSFPGKKKRSHDPLACSIARSPPRSRLHRGGRQCHNISQYSSGRRSLAVGFRR